ncbi:MAG TPA: DNA polymerase III subunit delta [Acetobacteraceae bacterium]|nr:DNA polymerase III subunit delta [Acetobacteraceae bacterium]
MKIDARRLPSFLRDPGNARVVLLYGDDVGMIREHAAALTRAVAGAPDDPFRVAELDRDEAGNLLGEAGSLPLTGGRRVVRLREAADNDATREAVRAVLESAAPALVIIEAGSLNARSALRKLVEAAPDGAAIGCYPDEPRAIADTIRETLAAEGVGADTEALAWLAAHLGADRAATRQELAKLALYLGPGGRADLAAATECVGDLAGLSLDDALFAATSGEVVLADRALELALAEGATPVGVLRAALMHVQRLHRARLEMDRGLSAAEAAKAARPPVFFRRIGAFARALALWPAAALMAQAGALSTAELACKRTGAPDLALCRGAVLAMAQRASRRTAR